MAWKERSVFEQRKLFIQDFESKKFNFSQLCKEYEITRPTGYLWIKRYEESGVGGLLNIKSTPHTQPNKTSPSVLNEILAVKFEWPTWGPKKILGYLNNNMPHLDLPSLTTVENILKRNGLVSPRKLRRRLAERSTPLAHANGVNDVWSADFKGWILTNDGYKFDPFTLTDNASRFLLKCIKLNINDTTHVWGILDIAFREYGLPLNLRTDNGPPFATLGPARLSSLSIKLIKAGVNPDFIEPGKPQQNGRHERMHGTMESECFSPQLDIDEQILKLSEFQNYYNYIRPHEALKQVPPGSVYVPSNRVWNGKFRSPEYVDYLKKAKVRSCGKIKLLGKNIYIGQGLIGEYVGLQEIEKGYKVYYGSLHIGDIIDSQFDYPRRKRKI
jgi:putative transposase